MQIEIDITTTCWEISAIDHKRFRFMIYFINRMHLFHIWNLFYILNRLRRTTFKCITTLYWFCIHKYKNMKNIQKYVACWTWIILNSYQIPFKKIIWFFLMCFSIEYSDYRFNLDCTLSANQSKTNSCDVLHFINANESNFNVNLINKR